MDVVVFHQRMDRLMMMLLSQCYQYEQYITSGKLFKLGSITQLTRLNFLKSLYDRENYV